MRRLCDHCDAPCTKTAGVTIAMWRRRGRLGEVTRWPGLVAAPGAAAMAVSPVYGLASCRRSPGAPSVGTVPDGADAARLRLATTLGRLNGSRSLVIDLAEARVPPLVVHVLDGALTAGDQDQFARLRDGLDRM